MEFDTFILICNYIGTRAFAASGAIKGFDKKLDIFGITLLAIVTAVGGGMLRDSIISHFPFALSDPSSIYLSIVVALVMYVFVINRRLNNIQTKSFYLFLRWANLVFDAVGLVIFSLIGATVLDSSQQNMMAVGMLATLTGVGGGIIRDLLSNEVPSVLKKDIYAVFSFGVGVTYYLLITILHLPRIPSFIAVFVIGLFLRLYIIKHCLALPNMDKLHK